MNDAVTHPLAMDGKDAGNLRGDPITPERYYSAAWMEKEWEHLWARIWHIAGRVQQLHRFTEKVVLSFDPDAAGQGAAAKSCEMLVSEGF